MLVIDSAFLFNNFNSNLAQTDYKQIYIHQIISINELISMYHILVQCDDSEHLKMNLAANFFVPHTE